MEEEDATKLHFCFNGWAAALSHAAIIPSCADGALAGVYMNANGTANGFACEISDRSDRLLWIGRLPDY
jgi:hypothetical protein